MTQSITIQRTAAAENSAAPKKTVVHNTTHIAGFWFAGWLFAIGFCKLVWWKALLALVLWPYFLGDLIAR
jgi:hypothetical protein